MTRAARMAIVRSGLNMRLLLPASSPHVDVGHRMPAFVFAGRQQRCGLPPQMHSGPGTTKGSHGNPASPCCGHVDGDLLGGLFAAGVAPDDPGSDPDMTSFPPLVVALTSRPFSSVSSLTLSATLTEVIVAGLARARPVVPSLVIWTVPFPHRHPVASAAHRHRSGCGAPAQGDHAGRSVRPRIRPRIRSKRLRVKWPSANSKSEHCACRIRRPLEDERIVGHDNVVTTAPRGIATGQATRPPQVCRSRRPRSSPPQRPRTVISRCQAVAVRSRISNSESARVLTVIWSCAIRNFPLTRRGGRSRPVSERAEPCRSAPHGSFRCPQLSSFPFLVRGASQASAPAGKLSENMPERCAGRRGGPSASPSSG
jgi:hypothetical protein